MRDARLEFGGFPWHIGRMRRIVIPCVLALASIWLGSGCSKEPSGSGPAAASTAKPGLPDRDPALAHKLVSEGALLLDVRTPEEYEGHHLDGAINIPVDQIGSRMAEIDKLTTNDKAKPIVVYCMSGGRAAQAKDDLVKAGHTQVTNLGSISNWDKK